MIAEGDSIPFGSNINNDQYFSLVSDKIDIITFSILLGTQKLANRNHTCIHIHTHSRIKMIMILKINSVILEISSLI